MKKIIIYEQKSINIRTKIIRLKSFLIKIYFSSRFDNKILIFFYLPKNLFRVLFFFTMLIIIKINKYNINKN